MAKKKEGKPEAPKSAGKKFVELYDVNKKAVKVPAGLVEDYLKMGYLKELPKKKAE